MDGKKRSSLMILAGVLVIGVILVAAVAPQAVAARWIDIAWAGRVRPAQSDPISLNDTYGGTVELDWALPGEFSDSLPTPTPDPDGTLPPDLGEIDLGLQLSQDGSTVSGYVDLDYTLVFTAKHTVDSTPFGPSVQGTFDGTNLTLESERVSMLTAGQQLMRQFRLTGGTVSGQDNVLRGEYRETVWGYGPQPLTVIGTFSLQRLVLGEPPKPPPGEGIYLPLILKNAP
jgi:hypothetical protein